MQKYYTHAHRVIWVFFIVVSIIIGQYDIEIDRSNQCQWKTTTEDVKL